MKYLKLLASILLARFRKITFRSEGEGVRYPRARNTFAYPKNISLGDHVHIGPGCHLDGAGGIEIRRGTIFAPGVYIYSRSHNFDRDLKALPFDNVMLTAPVTVGEYVWIGSRVTVLPGVTIGDGAVIGAGAVVARDVPPCAVVVGNPGKVVKYRNVEEFEALRKEVDPFVYTRLGHGKVFRRKEDV
ncbi:acyltransferase [Geomonas sp. RF6]|uniref:acyltransferase n=1 Tax=Geomonas sp. RF6 TaxID=2897342 RepID=UPI002ED9AF6D